MLDFVKIATKSPKKDVLEIYPKFILGKKKDLMIRGGDFYAVWVEERGLWSTDEEDVVRLVDSELKKYADSVRSKYEDRTMVVAYMWDSDSGSMDRWHKYCQKQQRDFYHMLDENLIFSNTELKKEDYASKRLNYPLEQGEIASYDKLMSTLYSQEERHKIEWAIGAIVTGDSKHIQKFLVLYGAAGTGKSTVLNIIQQLFEGYYSVFDAKALGSASNSFALEAFKTNPLIAIQHDGDLSKIEDNTRLNSLVSHEMMTVNEKFKSTYSNRFKCFLFMGTNKPVKITDGKSGLIRRLIDVHPTGDKVPTREYKSLMRQISFELGAIASHCRDVYLEDPGCYDTYIPTEMLGASNDFYNFVVDSYRVFSRDDSTTLKAAWEMYNTYCDSARVPYPLTRRGFKEELKNYFWEYGDKPDGENGLTNWYKGFRTDIFNVEKEEENEQDDRASGVSDSMGNTKLVEGIPSIFDEMCSDSPAQYANEKETPSKAWDKVHTKLSDIDTSKLHYVKIPENHIVIDFDIKDEDGNKCFEKNLEAVSKWPATYAEVSKGGNGIHLHYIYSGDPSKLSRIYDENIEIKVFTGKSSLRRRLTKCNNLPIATISSGLPLKGDDKLIQFNVLTNEKALRTVIKKNLNKEYHGATKPSVDFIFKVLEDAYNSGIKYDVSDMKNSIFAFAAQSSHQSDTCLKIVKKMKFKSEDPSDAIDQGDTPLVFYDVEVFPNLFLINWKFEGEGVPVVRMINPRPSDVEELLKFRLVGFNCRRYDNHILYAALMGYDNEQLYNLSQKIINSGKGAGSNVFFGEAYNLSYTDVYDFAAKKQSLKKWEIELGIHHQELGLPWDQPVPEEMWDKVAEYCDNDVIATEAVFNHLEGDFTARQILADLAGGTVNDTTNSLTTKFIFGNNRKPQDQFNYRNLAEPVGSDRYEEYREKFGPDYQFRVFDADGLPQYRDYIPGEVLPDGWSILPFFPGYKYECGKSTYLDEEIGEGGKVYSEPGMYGNVWDGDVSSMHPHSAIFEVLFGPKYTKAFKEIVDGRVNIKHEAWDIVDEMLDGKLRPYIQRVKNGELSVKALATALKIAINSVYGLTSANFANPFRDPRNKDNIVAKRGALFMTLLKREVQKLGYKVCHIKTDSIKIPDADQYIQDFVIKFGKEFGYNFETEAVFEKFCLVNDAVYIAKFKEPLIDKKTGEEIWWTATGKQFAVPYVFKTLFSKKPIKFEDMCEAFSVKSALYLDMNEKLPDVSGYENELDKICDKYKKGKISDTTYESERSRLESLIEEGHDYRFIGKVGQFCPVQSGRGGGVLVREQNGKYYAAAGTTGFRWLESELVRSSGTEENIDKSYYTKLVDDAVETISEYGDFEWFVSDDPYVSPPKDDFMNIPEDAPEELPWD